MVISYDFRMVRYRKEWFGDGEVKKVEDDDNGVLITQNIVAKGNEAKYVLEYGPTRSLILDDLTELGTLLFETKFQII